MHTKSMRTISALGLVFIAACAGSGSTAGDASKTAAAGPMNDPAIRAAIDSADVKFSAAFKAADATAAAALYAEDATSMPPNTEPLSGRAAIEKGYSETFKSLGKINDFTVQAKDVDIYPDHVLEIGTYTVSFTPAGAKAAMSDHGTYMNYWRKQADGSWKVHRDAIVSALPQPGAPPPPAKK